MKYFDILPVGTRLNYKDGTPVYEKVAHETKGFVWRSVTNDELVKEPDERYWFWQTDWAILNDSYYTAVFEIVISYRI